MENIENLEDVSIISSPPDPNSGKYLWFLQLTNVYVMKRFYVVTAFPKSKLLSYTYLVIRLELSK